MEATEAIGRTIRQLQLERQEHAKKIAEIDALFAQYGIKTPELRRRSIEPLDGDHFTAEEAREAARYAKQKQRFVK